MQKRLFYFLLAVLSGVLFALSWPARGVPVFIFFAFVPLFYIEKDLSANYGGKRKGSELYGWAFLAFLIWNLLTTWWLYNSLNPDGSHNLIAVAVPNLFNATVMSLMFWLFYRFKKRIPGWPAYAFLVALWISFEKLTLTWELTWPWLNLGNVFSGWHQWAQWYDITGALGGSLWVWVLNILAFHALSRFADRRDYKKLSYDCTWFLAVFLIPLTVSLVKYKTAQTSSKDQVTAVLLQPEVNPYTEKYSQDSITMTQNLLSLGMNMPQEKIDFFIAPETAIPGIGAMSENGFHHSTILRMVDDFLINYPRASFVTGASTYEIYPNEAAKSKTAYQIPSWGVWADSYNTALQIVPGQEVQTYHKGKLVPGVESFPYMSVLKPLLGDIMLNMGGTMASLGSDPVRKVFKNPFNGAVMAPIICYESAYGEFVTEYVKNGANLLAVVTNDSWWGVSPGHRQLLDLAKLRAVETRKSVVRSANSGISALINARGDVVESLPYDSRGILTVKADVFSGETFYVKYGDWIAKIAVFALLALVIYFMINIFGNRSKKNINHG